MTLLTSLESVRDYGRITGPDDDELLQRLIVAASAYIELWCSREFGAADRVEYLNGNGRTRLVLGHYPVLSVTSVEVNGMTIPQRPAGVPGSGWVADSLGVSLDGQWRFEAGLANVKIVYRAGYEELPDDLEQACIELVLARYKDRDRTDLASQGIGGENVVFRGNELSKFARSVLGQYKRVIL